MWLNDNKSNSVVWPTKVEPLTYLKIYMEQEHKKKYYGKLTVISEVENRNLLILLKNIYAHQYLILGTGRIWTIINY